MHPMIWATSIVFVGTLLGLEFGYRRGALDTKRNAQSHEGINAVETAAFALFGLLLAFSFAAAAARLEDKRQLGLIEVRDSVR